MSASFRPLPLVAALSILAAALAAGAVDGRSADTGEASTPSEESAPSLPDPLAAGWRGEPVCELLHEDAEQRVLRCTFPPGVGHERHYHPPHFGYVLAAGTMRIRDASGTRRVETEAGGHWTSDGVEWHEVVNVGETTAAYLIVEPR